MSEQSTSGTEQFRERPEKCPLCGEKQTGLDFHHWAYEPEEIGCYLCRDCHGTIHEGKGRRTKTTPWLSYCVENLVREHLKNRPEQNGIQEMADRYNLPTGGDYEFEILIEDALGHLGERSVDTATEHSQEVNNVE